MSKNALPTSLLRLFSDLEHRLALCEVANAALQTRCAGLEAENAVLRSENIALRGEVVVLKDEHINLRAQLKQNSKNSDEPPSAEGYAKAPALKKMHKFLLNLYIASEKGKSIMPEQPSMRGFSPSSQLLVNSNKTPSNKSVTC